MSELLFSCWVPGTAKPKGSVSAFVRGKRAHVVHQRPKDWEQAVRYSVAQDMASEGILAIREVAVEIELSFVLPRPKSAKRANPWQLANKRPDLDKLVRAVLDAITGLLVADDCQVVRLKATKRVGESTETPGVQIHMSRISS